uniref:AAA+ ATPase domain-containing protein n=1 Tax=viral metagenome TaxID=1070528 RepID=A0A6C0I3D9_9ZZZZ
MTELSKENIPWVEKYRPTHFDKIVLDPMNRKIFNNIIETGYFPNLLFYGPPGTGKTTTIMNLIQEYQKKYIINNRGTVIHLNASDERGIDIIRNQILQFVKSKNFFDKGLKFVILDEVDYMTKNAQQALKYLLQSTNYNVRFCLICNYISKIDESLKNEFISIRFNQLPKSDIYSFIKAIAENEQLTISDEVIDSIQRLFYSDIRSMINFIQLHQNIIEWEANIITNKTWESIDELLTTESEGSEKEIILLIHQISVQYNIDKKNILKQYFDYVIRNKPEKITSSFLNVVEVVVHSNASNMNHILQYFANAL